MDLPFLADTKLAIPYLLEECRSLLSSNDRTRIDARRQALVGRQEELRAKNRAYVESQWDHPEITETRLVAELWEVIKNEDFVFTHGGFVRIAPGVCSVNGPAQHLGNLGAGPSGLAPVLPLDQPSH